MDIDTAKVIDNLSQRMAELIKENATLTVLVQTLAGEHAACAVKEDAA